MVYTFNIGLYVTMYITLQQSVWYLGTAERVEVKVASGKTEYITSPPWCLPPHIYK